MPALAEKCAGGHISHCPCGIIGGNMYDISELEITGKGVAVAVLVVFVLLVVTFCAGYMLGLRNVHHNGGGAGDVGEQLGTAVSNQQSITAGIQNAEGTDGGIASAGQSISESAGHIEGAVAEAGSLIDQCQQIIGNIRNRGKKNTPAN